MNIKTNEKGELEVKDESKPFSAQGDISQEPQIRCMMTLGIRNPISHARLTSISSGEGGNCGGSGIIFFPLFF